MSRKKLAIRKGQYPRRAHYCRSLIVKENWRPPVDSNHRYISRCQTRFLGQVCCARHFFHSSSTVYNRLAPPCDNRGQGLDATLRCRSHTLLPTSSWRRLEPLEPRDWP